MTDWTRTLVRALALSLLAISLIALVPGCGSDDDEEKEAKASAPNNGERPPTAVRVATAKRGEIARTIPMTGEFLADKIVELAPLESGQLIELQVDEGDRVTTGQILGRLDKDLEKRSRIEASTRVDSARARVAAIEAELEAQRKEVERRRALVERKAFPAAELQKLEDQLAVLEQNAAVAKAEQDEARSVLRSQGANIDRRVIKAPFDGIVVTRHVTRGASVGPGTPILTIIDEDSMRFIAAVAEQRIGAIKDNNPAEITLDAYPDRTLHARVVEIGSLVDRDSRTIDVEMVIDDESAVLPSQQYERKRARESIENDGATNDTNAEGKDSAAEGSPPTEDAPVSGAEPGQESPSDQPTVVLRHGMFGRGGIIVDSMDNALIVPADALSVGSDGTQVWTVSDGTAQPVPVTVLLETEREAAVNGLSEGTQVIVSGTRMLKPGAPVTVSGKSITREAGQGQEKPSEAANNGEDENAKTSKKTKAEAGKKGGKADDGASQ